MELAGALEAVNAAIREPGGFGEILVKDAQSKTDTNHFPSHRNRGKLLLCLFEVSLDCAASRQRQLCYPAHVE